MHQDDAALQTQCKNNVILITEEESNLTCVISEVWTLRESEPSLHPQTGEHSSTASATITGEVSREHGISTSGTTINDTLGQKGVTTGPTVSEVMPEEEQGMTASATTRVILPDLDAYMTKKATSHNSVSVDVSIASESSVAATDIESQKSVDATCSLAAKSPKAEMNIVSLNSPEPARGILDIRKLIADCFSDETSDEEEDWNTEALTVHK
jgi:hypothetical protein